MNEQVKQGFMKRAQRLVKGIKLPMPQGYYIGGGCFGRTVNDIDVYPHSEHEFAIPEIGATFRSKNAVTFGDETPPVQFCRYVKPSLKALVESFDYAHCQIAAEVINGTVTAVYASDAFIESRMLEDTRFIGSEYPLSSLVRLLKYNKRETISKAASIGAILSIVAAVVERGFSSYEDFKDQFDAVDLGLLPDDLKDLPEGTPVMQLFELLNRGEAQ